MMRIISEFIFGILLDAGIKGWCNESEEEV